MKLRILIAIATFLSVVSIFAQQSAPSPGTLLDAAATKQLLPTSFFFDGKLAPAQARNSGAIKFADGKQVVACLVDTSGYSSSVQEKFQGVLINETEITIGDNKLPAGFYGFGISGGQFNILNVGADTLFTTKLSSDTDVKHPVPLKISQSGDGFRLYLGRNYVTITR